MSRRADALKRVLGVLDRLEISYLIGGSLASSAYGMPRMTMDADIVADIKRDQAEEFADELKGDFYADASMIKDAIDRGRPFHLIHLGTSFKIDIFPLRDDTYSKAQFARRYFRDLSALDDEPIECSIATAGDVVLNKLRSYRLGNEISEQQWNDDLRGIMKVSGPKLDMAYLNEWAPRSNVADLLEKLLNEES